MAQDDADLLPAPVPRVLAAVEVDEADDPVNISLLRAKAVVAETELGAHGIEEARRGGHGHHETAVDLVRRRVVKSDQGLNGRAGVLSVTFDASESVISAVYL